MHIIKRKVLNLLKIIFDQFLFLISFFLILLIKLINAFKVIRFNVIDRGRIGGFYPIEFYRIENKDKKNDCIDIFLTEQLTNNYNKEWYNFWKSQFNIFHLGRFSNIFCKTNGKYFGKKNIIPYNNFDKFPIKDNLIKTISKNYELDKFSLTEEIDKKAKYFFNNNNLKNGHFICVHNRDSAFLNKHRPGIDWSYHDYRDSSILNYHKTINHFDKKKIKVVRIGETALEKLDLKSKNILDYPFMPEKNSAIDLSLLYNCKFSVISETGLSIVPFVFRKPIVFTNWILLDSIHTYKEGVFILKKVFSLEKNRYLKFREIVMEIKNTGDGNLYQKKFKFEENDGEDILNVCIEMNRKIDGNLKYSDIENNLQNKFWSNLGRTFERNQAFRIGSDFLLKNQHLI